jgi:hypothetical protein
MHNKDISMENLKKLYPKLNETHVQEILDNYEELSKMEAWKAFSWRQAYKFSSATFNVFKYVINFKQEGSNFYNLIPEEDVQRIVKNGICQEQDIISCYFDQLESEAENKKPNEKTLLDEILVYGIKYRDNACNEAVGSMDPSW